MKFACKIVRILMFLFEAKNPFPRPSHPRQVPRTGKTMHDGAWRRCFDVRRCREYRQTRLRIAISMCTTRGLGVLHTSQLRSPIIQDDFTELWAAVLGLELLVVRDEVSLPRRPSGRVFRFVGVLDSRHQDLSTRRIWRALGDLIA
jgi:hypothetical protein